MNISNKKLSYVLTTLATALDVMKNPDASDVKREFVEDKILQSIQYLTDELEIQIKITGE